MDNRKLIQQLKKSSLAELRLGCTNAAVFGGFDRYALDCLGRLEQMGFGGAGPAWYVKAGEALRNYAELPRNKRIERAETLLGLLDECMAGLNSPAGVLPSDRSGIAAVNSSLPDETIVKGSQDKQAKNKGPQRENRIDQDPMGLDLPVQFVKHVGPQRGSILQNMGIFTAADLLYHFPRAYEDRSQFKTARELKHGERETIQGVVVGSQSLKPRRGLNITKVAIDDGSSVVYGVWYNQAHVKKQLPKGARLIVSGKVDRSYGAVQINVDDFEVWESGETLHTGRIVPMYTGSGKLNSRTLRMIIKGLLDSFAPTLGEFLPPSLLEKYRLVPLPQALQDIHFPQTMEAARLARRRFIFEELFLLQLGLARLKGTYTKDKEGIVHLNNHPLLQEFRVRLPFRLTVAQERVLASIFRDMESPVVMNRLVQGDVGSGKTVVAALALVKSVAGGYQGVLMAPTEILAEQHYLNLQELLRPLGIMVGLLTGSLTKKQKRDLLADIRRGLVPIIVGTHALIQEDVEFKTLGLVVIDEQHRFGVKQRGTLQQKGYNPDVLVMTATPIPRTLALTLYGDLDLSVIDELPPGRKPVQTYWVNRKMTQRMYRFIREQVDQGRQVYVVCPLVEDSEKVDLEAATGLAGEWQREVFPQYVIGLLHGRMKPSEKDAVMEDFRQGKVQILVSTTVIEVGVDVPNATMMVVKDAERFGLAQLHQLRGRVGRGEHQSYCLLVSDTQAEEGMARMRIMEKSTDGFVIAEEDLKLRGPGEFFGTRQSGLPNLKVADILRDARVLEVARDEAFRLAAADPNLDSAQHKALAGQVRRKFQGRLDFINIG
ncbi:MAG: ATP-dependent DNA helicase RecG [Clostridia bacterium]|nr:ATP-dependent DNA helicase RecG [Clostridia bacterium]